MKDPRIIFGRLGNSLFQYAYIYAQMKRGELPDIFLQDTRYFEGHEEEIRELFGGGDGSEPYVAVHLRRGDNPLNPHEPQYSKNGFYVDLAETGYYEVALSLFPNEKFLVFSDDLDFAKMYFVGDEYDFDETADPVEAMTRMSNCKSVIMANSSFSWWGGFLCNPQENYKIVAPSKDRWYSDGVERTLCPKSWIRI